MQVKRTTTTIGESTGARVVRALAALGLALALSLGGCDARSHQNTSGETHFLTACSQECTGGLECIAGACTQACTRTADCAELSSAAECVAVAAGSDRACDVSCEADRECDAPSRVR